MVGSSVSRARTLRRSMSGVELLLWSRLRRQQLGGHRFRRQAPIGPYIADFACFQARLLIEIDGPSHDARVQYDGRRTAWLVRRGFRVLRFAADDVLSRLDRVLETILLELADSPGPPSPGSAGYSPDFAGERLSWPYPSDQAVTAALTSANGPIKDAPCPPQEPLKSTALPRCGGRTTPRDSR